MFIDNSEHKIISIDGIDVSFFERGASGNPTVILIHGLGDCARSWDNFARSMADSFRVISLDSHGHGDSDKSLSGKYLLDDYLKDLQALEEECELEYFVLIGHGNGGRIALNYAHKNPNKVRGIVVVDSNLKPQEGSDSYFKRDIKCKLADDSFEPFINQLKVKQPLSSEEMLLHQANVLTVISKEGPRAWKHDVAVMENNDQSDLWHQWKRLKCPTLLLRGRQSTVISHEEAVRMKENVPTCSIVELEGGGHWIYQEAPGSFESAVRWFFEKHELT